MWNVIKDSCPAAQYTGIALEYGTLPLAQMIDALRADHWLEAHPEVGGPQAGAIKQQIRDAFYVDNDAWKQQLLEQALLAGTQALKGLNQ
jgi:hypothetical protein